VDFIRTKLKRELQKLENGEAENRNSEKRDVEQMEPVKIITVHVVQQ
jgi:hypothetical protein